METECVAKGRAVAVRADYTAGEVRRLAKQAKDGAQARRLLAIAAVLDGASRTEAAKIGGMDRQTLRDWGVRFNEQGPEGLIHVPSPGVPPTASRRVRYLGVGRHRLSSPQGPGLLARECSFEGLQAGP